MRLVLNLGLRVEMMKTVNLDTNLQQFEIVKVQWALRAGSLHHVEVVQPLFAISC